jgi:hypothetical protein
VPMRSNLAHQETDSIEVMRNDIVLHAGAMRDRLEGMMNRPSGETPRHHRRSGRRRARIRSQDRVRYEWTSIRVLRQRS